jgi:hypothetical protein
MHSNLSLTLSVDLKLGLKDMRAGAESITDIVLVHMQVVASINQVMLKEMPPLMQHDKTFFDNYHRKECND